MKRQNYYPNRNEAQPEWLDNFATKLPGYAAALPLDAAKVTAGVADARYLSYVVGPWINSVRSWAPACTDAVTFAESGSDSAPVVLPAHAAPALPAGVVAVNPGALDRLFTLVKDIKNAPGFTEAIGTDLGVIGQADTTLHPLPTFTLKSAMGDVCHCVHLTFRKYEHMGVVIQSRRGTGDWEELGVATQSPYDDERPLLVPTQPEVREYRLRFWDKGAATGEWTDVAKITVSP